MLVVLGVVGWVRVTSALAHVRLAQELMANGAIENGEAACDQVNAALDETGPLMALASLFGVLPLSRTHAWAQLPALAQAATYGCRAEPSAARLLASAGDLPPGPALAAALETDPSDALAVSGDLSAALDALNRVDPSALGGEPRLASLSPIVQLVQSHLEELRAAAAFPAFGSRLLGADGPRTYLILGQNNDESRATGGFIGTIARLTVENGSVISSDVRSSYLWDQPDTPKLPAPEPLAHYMNFGGWYIRDANWWVDYRRSVAQLLLLWDREQGNAQQIDGVIAIDRGALDLLLDAVGGVDVPELGGEVSSGTAEAALDERRTNRQQYGSDASYQVFKGELLSSLYRALLPEMTSARGTTLLKLLDAAAQAGRERHLLFWSRDNELQAAVAQEGWDGRVDPGDGDFVGVVDTTISYGKMTPYIDHSVSYARLPNGAAQVSLMLTNDYQPQPGAPWDPIVDGTWWDWHTHQFRREQGTWLGYERILAPAGARLLDSSGWDDPATSSTEGDVAVFGAPVLVHPGEARTVQVTYLDPVDPSEPLKVYQQPGTMGPLPVQRDPGSP